MTHTNNIKYTWYFEYENGKYFWKIKVAERNLTFIVGVFATDQQWCHWGFVLLLEYKQDESLLFYLYYKF